MLKLILKNPELFKIEYTLGMLDENQLRNILQKQILLRVKYL